MIELREYIDSGGRSPFAVWRAKLDRHVRAKVTTALLRLSAGNTSNVKAIGAGVNEVRIDFGPGYRVYFGWDGTAIVILLGGGMKKRQQQDIAHATERWLDYRRRKRLGG